MCTYTIDPEQVILTPIEPGLHEIDLIAWSSGASGNHAVTIKAWAWVLPDSTVGHVELHNGDVLRYWSWDRYRAQDAARARAERDARRESVVCTAT